jgi:hypothetical protein
VNAPLEKVLSALAPQLVPALRQEIADKTEVIGQQIAAYFWQIPMDRQGQKLNRFSRINLTYFSRATEWEDFEKLVRQPSEGVLEWHLDAISEVFNYSSGNPYFAKAACKEVMTRAVRERDADITAEEVRAALKARISTFESNQFAHLWQDGIYSPIEEREVVALKRRRTLAAITRCLRASEEPTLSRRSTASSVR